MDQQNREPLTEDIREEKTDSVKEPAEQAKPVPVYAERAETVLPEADGDELKALALSYARYLAEHDMKPGDPTFTDSEDAEIIRPEQEKAEEPVQEEKAGTEPASDGSEETAEKSAPEKKKDAKKKRAAKKKKAASGRPSIFTATQVEPTEAEVQKIEEALAKGEKKYARAGAVMDIHDRLQAGFDAAAAGAGRDFVAASHRIASTYRQSRRIIGVAMLIIGILAAVVLVIFDRFTVYEYAYNGKVLGYVKNQEDVTDVLDIAGTMLTENSSGTSEIKFTANQNVTFKQVDARGKSTDDADAAVNKLVYMTDIETEASGVYDGNELVAIVKSDEDAENLLLQTRDYLSTPDEGMELVSADFTNNLEIRPVNVLLTSVQSNYDAMTKMTEGGTMEIYHIVEDGETLDTLAKTFGADPVNIFNEDNSTVAEEILPGDTVCIHEEVEPVSVRMVEEGRMKETIEYETVKKESDDYYKGDTYTKQEGVNGVQIFDGTITKVAGEVTKRDGDTEVIKEKQDKIILVGTAERPKTAPTGTFAMPIQRYTLSSGFGYRWGRLHSGIDMAAPTGTPIYASDGGTVVRAGWYGGYGLCVDIQHGDGKETRYGHCSKLLVNVGDKVYQGQNISLVGNTGHSFGSHLHFEIHINGSPVNPRPILGI
jgi:murein DD-endopeptidase MepM/ murein hydrolase activator NlpD